MVLEGHTNRRVMIVDDQKEIHDDFVEMLTSTVAGDGLASAYLDEGEPPPLPDLDLLHARSGEEACAIVSAGRARSRPVAVAYIDIRMPPGMDGIETMRRVREIDPDVEIVVMTAYSERRLPDIIQSPGPVHKVLYIHKPFTPEEIQQITLSLVEKWGVERDLAASRRQLALSHARLEAVLNASNDSIALYDLDGGLLFANQSYQTLIGMKERELRQLPSDAAATLAGKRFHKPDLVGTGLTSVFHDMGEILELRDAGEATEKRLFHRATSRVCDSQGGVVGELYVYRDVSRELKMERMRAEVLRLRLELDTKGAFEGIVGNSRGMQHVYTLMRQVADSDMTVLILGESGTGKELVARLIHSNSQRKDRPFVAVNCAAIPESLIESELFGHEQGAFTGAIRQRIGAFERAKGGTILLDEIGDMQPVLQGRLLRALQEGEVQRLGGSGNISVDARVIVATNKDLDTAVRGGSFREDLWYRIAGFPIVIPPLRERRSDIRLLANHFLKKHAERSGRSVVGISAMVLHHLLQYHWPGNVRELDNVIGRAVLVERTEVLQPESLPSHILRNATNPMTPAPVLSLAEVERRTFTRALAEALDATGNNISMAARLLEIDRVTLHRKLKRYGLTSKT